MEKRLNFLLDTNIWLERLLEQAKSKEVKKFLDQIPLEQIFISDFTLHSIGVILFRLDRPNVLREFLEDVFQDGLVKVLSLNPLDQLDLIDLRGRLQLDFDDAYQFRVAEKFELTLVSLDKYFKKAKSRVYTPSQALEIYKNTL